MFDMELASILCFACFNYVEISLKVTYRFFLVLSSVQYDFCMQEHFLCSQITYTKYHVARKKKIARVAWIVQILQGIKSDKSLMHWGFYVYLICIYFPSLYFTMDTTILLN